MVTLFVSFWNVGKMAAGCRASGCGLLVSEEALLTCFGKSERRSRKPVFASQAG